MVLPSRLLSSGRTKVVLFIFLTPTFFRSLANDAPAVDFSGWSQVTGVRHIDYRWRATQGSGCDLEFRNLDARDHRKYKTRVVFQTNHVEESTRQNTMLSFEQAGNQTQNIVGCIQITDVSVTRF